MGDCKQALLGVGLPHVRDPRRGRGADPEEAAVMAGLLRELRVILMRETELRRVERPAFEPKADKFNRRLSRQVK